MKNSRKQAAYRSVPAPERSRQMALVRSCGNRSTEWRLRLALVRRGIAGWTLHARELPGRPDFVFVEARVAVFVDGCFWHACRACGRPLPRTNRRYWSAKIAGNVRRARRVDAALRREGFVVLHVWEHALRTTEGIERATTRVARAVADRRALHGGD